MILKNVKNYIKFMNEKNIYNTNFITSYMKLTFKKLKLLYYLYDRVF